ncbi:MAG: NERD domain-containing protein [Candidatus Oceanisphaera merdipullorum]|nr:NERD domain-containing protein [Candidatus Oceanisphaera merdipullorum]
MANFEYVTANKLTRDAHGYKHTNRTLVLMVGLGITFVVSAIYLPATPLALLLTAGLWWSQKSSPILLAGAAGEDLVIDLLRDLPDTFTVYNQVDIPNAKSRTGFNEADVIVVGPNAVFIIEVKHNSGSIKGADGDSEWRVEKTSRGGNVYGKTMRNPISQVKRLVWLLSKDLKAKHSRAWIQGVVLFSHQDVAANIDNDSNVPVMGSNDIVNYIASYQAKVEIANNRKLVGDIAALKGA